MEIEYEETHDHNNASWLAAIDIVDSGTSRPYDVRNQHANARPEK